MSEIPWTKAAEKLSSARTRWNGELGAAIRAFGPVAWPGVPATALQSFTMNGSQRENTGVARLPNGQLANPTFHEIGFFQTPAGPSSGPAPNPDPEADHNAYGRLGRSDRVKALVGGNGVDLSPDAWKERVRDQTAVGLYDFLEEGHRVAAAVPALAPSSWSTPWAFALAVSGYVVGAGATTTQLRAHEAELASVSEANRVDAFVRIAAEHPTRALAYPALRVWQRLEYGRVLANDVGQSTAWYPTIVPGSDRAAIAEALVAAYERRPATAVDSDLVYDGAGNNVGKSPFVPILVTVAGVTAVYFGTKAVLRAHDEGRITLPEVLVPRGHRVPKRPRKRR